MIGDFHHSAPASIVIFGGIALLITIVLLYTCTRAAGVQH
jgi:hypothetical protein